MRWAHFLVVLWFGFASVACGRVGYDGIGPTDSDAGIDQGSDAFVMDGGADDLASDLGAAVDAGSDLGDDMGMPGVLVSATSGLVTTEMGGSATFTLSLEAAPTANVTIALSSSDEGEGTVAPASVVFTPLDWNALHTVTITGVDDSIADGSVSYTIVTGAAVSSDVRYSGLNADDVSVINTDDETPGVTVVPTSGLVTAESGSTDTFTVVLNAEPVASVTISLVSDLPTEASVAPATLTFTTTNWAAAQTVTVTGVDDSRVDGDVAFTIESTAASTDTGYDGIAVSDVAGTNQDNDMAGITVTQTSPLTTDEAGATATFTVQLVSQPAADVQIALESTDTTEGDVSSSSIVFTASNWNVPRVITVTDQNDDVQDGDQMYEVNVGPSTSADPEYAGLSEAPLMLVNDDDDTASYTLTPSSGLVTTEAGGTATFEVAITSEPVASVIFSLSSSDASEGVVSPTTLTFNRFNWPYPQTVTLTGVNDALADGDIAYRADLFVISADSNYAALAPGSVLLTNTDDESSGVTVSPTSGLVTTEAGGTATFTVVLNAQPTASVSIGLSSDTLSEGTVAPASLTFSTVNWGTPQTVTVTGVNDFVADGMRAYEIVTAACTSADLSYNGINPANVSVSNTDNDAVGITVSPLSINAPEGGAAGTFTVVLTSQPTANVTIPVHLASIAQGSIAPASRTFTTGNWNVPQSFTVTAVDDALTDGTFVNTAFTDAATSTDIAYGGFDADNVVVNHFDNDAAGIVVTPTSGLVTTEAGATASFTVALTALPSADVTINLASSNAAEGTVLPASLTFTTLNWNTPRTVTVTGVDDFVDDGNVAYTIVTSSASSSDGTYNGLAVADVAVSNTDNDSVGVTIMTGLLQTTEAGAGITQFTLRLNSQPTADVTIYVASNDLTEGTVSTAMLTFTTMNWSAPQTVVVTGVDDAVADGNMAYQIVLTGGISGDVLYSGINPADVGLTNIDDDGAVVTVSPTSGLVVSEAGTTATFSIVLGSQPTANVTISLSTSDASESSVLPTSATFTTANWATPQIFTVTGVNDVLLDGPIAHSIVTGACVSSDANYNGLNPSNVGVTTTDDDTAGISVSPTSGLYTTEAGATATFSVYLTAGPSTTVTISLSSSNPAEAQPSPSVLMFTPVNYATPQTVTVTGIDDPPTDGDQVVTIITAPAMSGDLYAGLDAADVSVTNIDDEPQRTVSCDNTYVPRGGLSPFQTATSANGRYVVFNSSSSNLVAGDTNGSTDVFLRDRVAHTTTRVSTTGAGAQIPANSQLGALSDNGRYLCFATTYSLAGDDTNSVHDIYLKDLMTGSVARASLSSTGAQLSEASLLCDVSDDGRYVAFASTAVAVPGSDELPAAYTDAFVRDMMLGTTAWASRSIVGNPDGVTSNLTMTPDGRYLAFDTAASLVGYEALDSAAFDVYRYDILMDVPLLISFRSDNTRAAIGGSYGASISASGRYVAFHSSSSQVVAGDTNGYSDIFVRDTMTSTTTRVSVSSAGAQATERSMYPSISSDGQVVSFASLATNLVAGDTNGFQDIFVRKVATSSTLLLSRSPAGVIGNAISGDYSSMSADGTIVSVVSYATNMIPNDTNGAADVFAFQVP
ncbi:MAG: hypothetical protein IPK60_10245 [Sandaracinaceae bacterium]|nr:hypothetical protein [Sandaracinaceae bacterium]